MANKNFSNVNIDQGILDEQAAPQGGPVPTPPVEGMDEGAREGEVSLSQIFNISPEVERGLEVDKDKMVTKGMKLIHTPKSRESILKMLNWNRPIDTIATATNQIITQLDKVSGYKVNDLVKVTAGIELMGQIIELGEAAERIPVMSDEEVQTSLAVTTEKYLKQEIKAGRVDQEALAASMEKAMAGLEPEQLTGLQEQLTAINNTAVGSTMQGAGAVAGMPAVEEAGGMVQETVEDTTLPPEEITSGVLG